MKSTKKGTNISANMLNFQYDRPVTGSYTTTVSTKRHSRTPRQSFSTIQLMQTTFKLVLDPFLDPREECLYNPDLTIPWENVLSVLVNVDNEHSLHCPICLSLARVPKIAKCGHTFCYTCILRHMDSDVGKKYSKCPLCNYEMVHNDLRNVKFLTRQTPEKKKMIEFQLLRHKDGLSLSPTCVGPLLNDVAEDEKSLSINKSAGGNTFLYLALSDVVPIEGTMDGIYSRVTVSSLEGLDSSFQDELNDLIEYRQECLDSRSNIPTIVSSSSFSFNYNSNSSESQVQVQSITKPSTSPSTRNIWLDRIESANTTNVKPTMTSWDYLDSDITSSADVEYLPYIAIGLDHLESQRQLYSERFKRLHPIVARKLRFTTKQMKSKEIKIKNIPKTDSEGTSDSDSANESFMRPMESPDNSLSKKQLSTSAVMEVTNLTSRSTSINDSIVPNTRRDRSLSESSLTRENSNSDLNSNSNILSSYSNYFYQISDGGLVFLHPLCLKCLLTQYSLSLSSSTTTNSSSPKDTQFPLEPQSMIIAKVIDIESFKLTRYWKQKHTFLKHIPEGSNITFVEIELQSLVSKQIMSMFASEFEKRRNKRKDVEKKILREKRLDEKQRREEEDLLAARKEQSELEEKNRMVHIQRLFDTPTTNNIPHIIPDESNISSLASGLALTSGSPSSLSSVPSSVPFGHSFSDILMSDIPGMIIPSESKQKSYQSFSKVAQMGGEFPTLGEVMIPSVNMKTVPKITKKNQKSKLTSALDNSISSDRNRDGTDHTVQISALPIHSIDESMESIEIKNKSNSRYTNQKSVPSSQLSSILKSIETSSDSKPILKITTKIETPKPPTETNNISSESRLAGDVWRRNTSSEALHDGINSNSNTTINIPIQSITDKTTLGKTSKKGIPLLSNTSTRSYFK